MKPAWTLPKRHLARIRKVGTVFDIGVSRGTPELYAAIPDAYYVLVEPLAERKPDLQRILDSYKGEYLLAAAGAEAGTAVINVEPKRSAMSSLLDRTSLTATGDRLESREIPVTTLDAIAAERNLERPYGVKIDTEGYELAVVKGAHAVLADARWVIVETSTRRRFQGGYRPVELLDEMRRRGFVVYDVLRSTRTFTDLLFMRNDAARQSRRTPASRVRRALRRR